METTFLIVCGKRISKLLLNGFLIISLSSEWNVMIFSVVNCCAEHALDGIIVLVLS